nr:hypothetical protein CFP56_09288 [Quercus suber]
MVPRCPSSAPRQKSVNRHLPPITIRAPTTEVTYDQVETRPPTRAPERPRCIRPLAVTDLDPFLLVREVGRGEGLDRRAVLVAIVRRDHGLGFLAQHDFTPAGLGHGEGLFFLAGAQGVVVVLLKRHGRVVRTAGLGSDGGGGGHAWGRRDNGRVRHGQRFLGHDGSRLVDVPGATLSIWAVKREESWVTRGTRVDDLGQWTLMSEKRCRLTAFEDEAGGSPDVQPLHGDHQ